MDAGAVFVKVHEKSGAATDADTPFMRIMCPANSTAALGAGTNLPFDEPIALTNGLTVRTTLGILDSDTAAISVNEVLVNARYGPA